MAFKSRRGQCTHSFVQFRYLCSEWISHFPVIVLISAEFASVAICPNFFHKMTGLFQVFSKQTAIKSQDFILKRFKL